MTTQRPSYRLVPLGLLGCAVLLPGCFSARTTEQMRVDTLQAVLDHRQADAVGTLNELYDSHFAGEPDELGGSPTSSDSINAKQQLLWHMERGLVDHTFGNLITSDRHLDLAGEIVDVLRTKSVTKEVATFVGNDTIRDYAGNAFEHTQVDYYRALNRLLQAEVKEGVYAPTQLMVTLPPPATPPPPLALNTDISVSVEDNYDRAVNFTRRMTINQLQETADAAGSNRYDDDPFARFLAATLTYAPKPGDRAEANRQFADVMLKRAMDGYIEQAKILSGDQPFRYEVQGRPETVERMYIRHCQAYDKDGFTKSLSKYGFSENDPRLKAAELPDGFGSVLVLNHVGFITHPEVLDIRVVTGQFRGSSARTAEGKPAPNATRFKIGAVAFWATGPGSDVVKTWGVVPIPGDIIQKVISPGGAAFMGFALPVHDHDQQIPAVGSVSALPANGGAPITRKLEVLTDLDAFARATLKDDQPELLAKTIIRAAAKQAAVAVAARQVEKETKDKGGIGQALGLLTNLVGSTAMTLSEIADTRAWTSLPDHITGTLLDLPAGRYTITLDTPAGPVECGGVVVEPGRVVVVPIRTFPEPLRYKPR